MVVAFDHYMGTALRFLRQFWSWPKSRSFSGVVSRYVFHIPLVWADELASTLFLWLSMMGAVVALRRGAHMRMTAVVSKLSNEKQALVEVIGIVASLAFLVMFLWPAWEYASDEAIITTPALEISNMWRAIAIPLGCALMETAAPLVAGITGKARDVAIAVVTVVVLVGLFYLLGSSLRPLGKLNLFIFFIGVVGVAVFSGVPIAFSFALATFGYLALTTRTPMPVMVGRVEEGMSHLVLLAVPLLCVPRPADRNDRYGQSHGSVPRQHARAGARWLVVCADRRDVSRFRVFPVRRLPIRRPWRRCCFEMKARGAKAGDLVALLSVTGAQTETVPPSIVLITVGSVTGG